jgi:hypothetical protein
MNPTIKFNTKKSNEGFSKRPKLFRRGSGGIIHIRISTGRGNYQIIKTNQLDLGTETSPRLCKCRGGCNLDAQQKRRFPGDRRIYEKLGKRVKYILISSILINSTKDTSCDCTHKILENANIPLFLLRREYDYLGKPQFEVRNVQFSPLSLLFHFRSCITAMQDTCNKIFSSQSLHHVEGKVAPLEEVFRLQDAHELKQAEEKYFPTEKK